MGGGLVFTRKVLFNKRREVHPVSRLLFVSFLSVLPHRHRQGVCSPVRRYRRRVHILYRTPGSLSRITTSEKKELLYVWVFTLN